jgi:membrane-bound lytic murein transglycosylase D
MSRGFLYLLLGWVMAPVFGQDSELTSYDYIPDATYEEMSDRISCIENEIPLVFNERVKSFIDYFTVRDRDYTREILNRKDFYFSLFQPYIDKYDIPEEIKYLAIVESGLRPDAISRANAVGMWQFISSTGRNYGLNGDWYVDERMDPYKATDAAVRHLLDLHRMFDDWELAIAAYNCGPGNVRKAIRRSGYKKRFWDIYRYLPRETRSYLPQFVAIAYALNYAEEHNLYPTRIYHLPRHDTIRVSQYLHLETLSNQLGLCVDDLLFLNPDIKRGALPEETRDYALKIPSDLKTRVVSERSFLYDTAGKVGKEHLQYLARNMPGSTFGRKKINHRVKSGDVLGTIAHQYHVRISDIKEWNGLRSNLIRVGQNLSIWVLPSYSSATKDLYASANTNRPISTPTPEEHPNNDKKLYQVRHGDTLWEISQKQNVSIEKLKTLNRLRGNTIHPGQQLIIGTD